MATYRNIHTSFWHDPFVMNLTPEEKYFFLYLMTNPKTKQTGIYELPKLMIEFDTGYNKETIDKLIDRFIDYGKILYDQKTQEIMIVNWLKYNYSNSPKVLLCIKNEIKEVKSKVLINRFNTVCKEYKYSIDTSSQEEKEKEEEKEEEEEEESIDREFERFWTLYDKKINRGECLKNWKKISKKDKKIIFETLPKYIDSTPDTQYRKNPLTYLRNKSWNDEIISRLEKSYVKKSVKETEDDDTPKFKPEPGGFFDKIVKGEFTPPAKV